MRASFSNYKDPFLLLLMNQRASSELLEDTIGLKSNTTEGEEECFKVLCHPEASRNAIHSRRSRKPNICKKKLGSKLRSCSPSDLKYDGRLKELMRGMCAP